VLDIDNQQFVYYNAGHPPIIRYKKSTSEVEIIRSSGAIPIGWIEDYEFIAEEEDVLQMDEYSSYFFYTDGLFECENPQGEELGIDGIIELMKNYPSDSSTLMLPYVLKKMIIDKGFDISADDFTILNLNLRRDLNDKIRYYIIDPRKNSTGETGKYCEEFLKARDAEELSFATELLVNEYLNKVLAHSAAGYKDDIIVIRLRLIKDELQLTFWDKGEAWELPAEDGDDDFLTDPDSDKSSLYIIRRLAEKIIQKRLAEVNETIFYLSMNKEENGSNGK
jgi:sigma-B regulation protein RsbU (phosphoserine phosphatase)